MCDDQAVSPGRLRWFRQGKVFLSLVVLLVLATGSASRRRSRSELDLVPRAAVRRTELTVILRAGGLVESSLRTVIRCELENLRGRKAATSILELVPEGSMVKKGEVLGRLDASEHEELERLQFISVAQARADQRRAELDLDAAKTALGEYREGRYRLESQGFEGRIALAKAEVAQMTDRLSWSRRMLAKGYRSRAQISAEVSALQRAQFALSQVQTESRNFQDYGFPRTIRLLESQIESARSNLVYQSLRLRWQEQRLAQLQRQVDLCTIRAPHDGLLVYAHKPKRDVRIEEGAWVRQRQELLYLPDLSRLEVQVLLHETVVERVRPGMRARVRLGGSAGWLEGELSAIELLPVVDGGKWSSGEVKNFVGRVQLDRKPPTLRPGMTAEVEITTARLDGALVIPAEAPLRENGRDVCYVWGRDGFERRAVTLGQGTAAWLEVTEGVIEGEEVALSAAFPWR
jgi:HlyD family secretion protein